MGRHGGFGYYLTMSKISKSDEEWKEQLSAEQYRVTRQAGTEAPYSGEYEQCWDEGNYHCVCCGHPLFDSNSKFNAGCGWPSFCAPTAMHTSATFSLMDHNQPDCVTALIRSRSISDLRRRKATSDQSIRGFRLHACRAAPVPARVARYPHLS